MTLASFELSYVRLVGLYDPQVPDLAFFGSTLHLHCYSLEVLSVSPHYLPENCWPYETIVGAAPNLFLLLCNFAPIGETQQWLT